MAGVILVASTSVPAQEAGDLEWRTYGSDLASTRYSPADQINADNFNDLELAWSLSTDNFGPEPEFNFQSTPLMVDGVIYSTAGTRRAVFAADAATGELLWTHRFDEGERGANAPRRRSGRGLAFRDNDGAGEIFYVTPGYQLIGLDAATGRQLASFGDNGLIDLKQNMDQEIDLVTGEVGLHAAPIVAGDTILIGAAHLPGSAPRTLENVKGYIRGFDANTGDRKWIFHTIPTADEFGNDTWLNDSWRYTGNTGVWGQMTVDEDLGIAYFATEMPTNDYYGGHRLGDNLFAESLVAVDGETGQRMWHFQAVHHGVWDYDFPAAPSLVDITVDGRPIKAIAQVSKQGFTYVFDRITGEPVWPIEERAVETDTDLEGEVLSPTQPFPTKPPPFDYQGVEIDDLVDFTPEIRALAVEAVQNFRLGPLFTPPMLSVDGGLQGTIQRPQIGGAATWSGSAVDPETGFLYVPSSNSFSVLKYYTPDPEEGGNLRFTQSEFGSGTQPVMPRGLPLFKPPYSRMTAIDLNVGEHAWMQPNGDGNRYRNHPMLRDLDLPPLGGDGRGGAVVTKTLMVSALTAGGSDGGPRLIARNKLSGDIVGSIDLPAGAIGTPMTYMHNGEQYIALTVGGDVPTLIALVLQN